MPKIWRYFSFIDIIAPVRSLKERKPDVKQTRRCLLSFAFISGGLYESAAAGNDAATGTGNCENQRDPENSESGPRRSYSRRALRQRAPGHRTGSRLPRQRRRPAEKSLLGRGFRRQNFF